MIKALKIIGFKKIKNSRNIESSILGLIVFTVHLQIIYYYINY